MCTFVSVCLVAGHSLTLPSPALFRALTFRPHLVHLFDTCPIALLTSFVLWLLDIPYVWSHHTRIDHYVQFLPQPGPLIGISVLRAFGTLMCNLCSTHMMVDDAMRNETPWLQNVDDGCKFFWKSGCDVNIFTPEARSQSTREWISGGRPDLPVVAFVGRMAYEKNIKLLPDLIKKFTEAGLENKCRWVIVGSGPADNDVRSQLEGFDNVVFTGRLGKEELAKVYASADMLFNPTVTGGCDLVLLEAQAAGLAVLASAAVNTYRLSPRSIKPDDLTAAGLGCGTSIAGDFHSSGRWSAGKAVRALEHGRCKEGSARVYC